MSSDQTLFEHRGPFGIIVQFRQSVLCLARFMNPILATRIAGAWAFGLRTWLAVLILGNSSQLHKDRMDNLLKAHT